MIQFPLDMCTCIINGNGQMQLHYVVSLECDVGILKAKKRYDRFQPPSTIMLV